MVVERVQKGVFQWPRSGTLNREYFKYSRFSVPDRGPDSLSLPLSLSDAGFTTHILRIKVSERRGPSDVCVCVCSNVHYGGVVQLADQLAAVVRPS